MSQIIEPAPHKEEIIQKKRSKIKVLIFGLIALFFLFLIVFAAFFAVAYFKKPDFLYQKFFAEKTPKLWAVYLIASNAPITYYGEITKWGKEYIVVKNPAYIDVQRPAEGATTTQPTVTFRRLSDEFYRPEPEARFFKQNIIFLQELAGDSPIFNAYKQAP